MRYELKHGDCLDVLRSMPESSVDSVVTDPPYGLAFMGKKWDYDVPSEEIWRECLRVLKPGGHLLAFAGTRTQHRMAVRIEDAGFEIRDMIAWVYGSGFPKSLDVSKAIDKMDAVEEQQARRFRFTEWVVSRGMTAKQINAALDSSDMGRHYTDIPPNGKQPAIMTREHLEACRVLLGDIPEWVERECDIRSVESRNMAARQVVDTREMRDTKEVRISCSASAAGYDSAARAVVSITAPATDSARQWDGWGTALKPALEPITVARKPLVGTVAANVLAHGTGGINVDGCRVRWSGEADAAAAAVGFDNSRAAGTATQSVSIGKESRGGVNTYDPLQLQGRWPANLIHDGSDEVVGLFPQTGASKSTPRNNGEFKSVAKGRELPHVTHGHDDNGGSAARFFYCAKASKADRDADNIHPTVKPTDLMRYLCRLVTPPNGIVLDPFMGSGSTGKSAMLEGFGFIGIERDAGYLEIAKARIAAAVDTAASSANGQRELF